LIASGPGALESIDACVVGIYCPPWQIFGEHGSQTEAPGAPFLPKAFENWSTATRRLLTLRRKSQASVFFVDRLSNTPEDIVTLVTKRFGSDRSLVESQLSSVYETLDGPMNAQLSFVLESFVRMNMPDLASVHDAVTPILEGKLPSEVGRHEPDESMPAETVVTKLHDTLSWIAALERSKLDSEQRLVDESGALKGKLDQLTRDLEKAEKLRQDFTKRATSAEEESELLLMQLHQVQEELESYYLSNKNMRTILTNSAHALRGVRQTLFTKAVT
jgi:predicted ribosome quality control (RQC) complex YloA/Tae2 family protein